MADDGTTADDDEDERDPRLRAAWAAFRSDDAGDGERHARAFIAEQPDHGAGWYALACCLERRERFAEADRCFRRAARTATARRPSPYRCSWRRFDQIVTNARDALRPDLRAAFEEVELVLVDYADAELITGFEDAEILGLFIGPVRGDREAAAAAGEPPPRIILFRRAHEHACHGADEFAEELKRTLYHEFGHYLGYGEDGIAQLGLA